MPVSDGKEAGLVFLGMVHGEMIEEERMQSRQDLLQYCGLDSEGMAILIDRLGGLG